MTTWSSGRLDDRSDLSRWDCGVPSLNQWLSGRAREAQARGTAATNVWTAPATGLVVAYYAIAPHQLRREQVPSGMAGGVTVIFAYLLARLALDVTLHGQGLGAELLHDAIDGTAAAFYRHHDFQPVRDNPHRLVLKVATVRKVLGR